jgi:hypothetical protein
MQRKGLAAAAICMLLLVSGCSNQAKSGIGVLDEPAANDRTLPANLYRGEMEPDSARFVGEHEGISYFLAKPADPGMAGGVCIVAVEAESSACGGPSNVDTQLATLGVAGAEARVVRDGANTTDLTDDGWTQVHENLLVR